MNQSEKHSPISSPNYCVTVIGSTPTEYERLEDALNANSGLARFNMRHELSASLSSFPVTTVHAIVLTPTSLALVTGADVVAVRKATKPGTCRVYLLIADRMESTPTASLLDDFIQRSSGHEPNEIATQIAGFFREAESLNRRTTPLALRDKLCLGLYKFLGVFWSLSYLVAALLLLTLLRTFAGPRFVYEVLVNSYIVLPVTFFGAFFIVHCAFAVSLNFLFGIRIRKKLDAGFAIRAAIFILAASATACSITTLHVSPIGKLACTVLAITAHLVYRYAFRIRAECTSLSEIRNSMADPGKRFLLLNSIGSQRFTPSAFPLFSFRSATLFISYMHGSQWSSETAAAICQSAADQGMEVFLDRSTIPSGTLWRQLLLRGLSECGCFVAVLDGTAAVTDWVLAESSYAMLLRKSIGKPRILCVLRNAEKIVNDRQNPFHVIYQDVLHQPPELCYGAKILVVDHATLTPELILKALRRVQPMGLLS